MRAGNAIVCSRGPARRPESQKSRKPEIPKCRHPGCDRAASQAGWGCRPHWFKLPLDLRARLHFAAAGGDRRAWTTVAEEADRWLARPKPTAWRQPELPL